MVVKSIVHNTEVSRLESIQDIESSSYIKSMKFHHHCFNVFVNPRCSVRESLLCIHSSKLTLFLTTMLSFLTGSMCNVVFIYFMLSADEQLKLWSEMSKLL